MFLKFFLHLSFICLSFFFHFSFIFLSFVCLFLSLFLVLLLLSGAHFFLPRLPHNFLLKLLCKKSFFWGRLGRYPIGPSFFSSIFHVFFIFVFFFNFFPCFSLFSFVFLFSILIPLFSFCLPFSFCFSFFFSRVLKICGGTPGFLG